MHSLQYPSAFQLHQLPKQRTTTASSINVSSLPTDMDSAQTLLALVAASSFACESDGSNVSSSPESTNESPNMAPLATSSPTSQTLSLAELFNQTTNAAVSLNNTVTPPTVSPPKTAREARIKRPMNAFMVWSQQRRQQISATGQKYHNSDISKMLGAEWRKMADQDKSPFVQRAKQLREDHLHQYPDYVYRPRRRKRVGKSSGSVDSVSTDEAAGSPTTMSNNFYTSVLTQLLVQCVMRNGQLPTTSPPPTTDASQPKHE